MGNSEVGHLNLGAGRVVRQDLTRIDKAIADGELVANPVLRAALRPARDAAPRSTCLASSRTAACTPTWTHLSACIELAARARRRATSCCTPSPTAATRRRTTRRRLPGARREAPAARVGSASSDATTRWTATSAGSGSQLAYDLLVHGRAAMRPPTGEQAVRGGLRARRDRRVHRAHAGRRAGADPAGRRGLHASTSGPTGCARSRARSPSRASARSICPAGAERDGVATVTLTMTRVRGGLAATRWRSLPSTRDDAARSCSPGAALRQLHVAETEKYPHVTYFFNGGEEAPWRASGASWCPHRGTCRPTTTSPQMSAPEAADAFVGAGARTSRASGSSTSPTPTWSGTRA